MPATIFKLVRWDIGKSKLDIRASIELEAKVDDVGTIVPMNEEADVTYHSKDDSYTYSAILHPDGKLIFDTEAPNEREGSLGIYGKPARVGGRVPFVERFDGVPVTEDYEIVSMESYTAQRVHR